MARRVRKQLGDSARGRPTSQATFPHTRGRERESGSTAGFPASERTNGEAMGKFRFAVAGSSALVSVLANDTGE